MAFALGATPTPSQPAADSEVRLSLDVREVDVKDVVGLLAEAAGRQTVVDADVACRLTLKLKGIAWRAAMESALRACRLGIEEEGRILRVAPLQRLVEEGQERRTLAEEQARARPVEWTAVRLSYARAAELAPVLAKFLPPGSQVAFDTRTNTLFVKSP